MIADFIYHVLTKYLDTHKHLSQDKFNRVFYLLTNIVTNVIKISILYLTAFTFNVLVETTIMSLSYVFIRRHAFGWHAQKALNCSIISILCFVAIPLLIKTQLFPLFSLKESFSLIGIAFFLNLKYAPSDTEKNPLVNSTERILMKRKTLRNLILLISILFFPLPFNYRTLIVVGVLLESIMISPVVYKLTKRGFNNYEKYEDQSIKTNH